MCLVEAAAVEYANACTHIPTHTHTNTGTHRVQKCVESGEDERKYTPHVWKRKKKSADRKRKTLKQTQGMRRALTSGS